MAQQKIQTVRFADKTAKIETITIRGIECLRLEDVQRQFPSVTALSIDDVQLAFETDKNGENQKPLHVKACKDRIIEALAPATVHNDDSLKRIEVITQEIQNQMRHMMRQMYELHEFTTPRYFFILPAKNHDWAAVSAIKDLFRIHYKLYFLCECSNNPAELHVAPHEGYSIKKPKEFIAKYGPYLRTTLGIVQVLFNLAGFALPKLGSVPTSTAEDSPLCLRPSVACDNIKMGIELVENLLDINDAKMTAAATSIRQKGSAREVPLQGADLRELASYLQVVDPNNRLGDLYRTVTADGHVRWVCLQHYDKISSDNQIAEYIRQWKTIGGRFNEDTKEVIINQVNLSGENVKIFCQTLEKGFNIAKLVFEKCSIYEGDLDKLLDVMINRSPIHCLEMITLDVRNLFRKSKYVCQYIIIHFNNQSLKIRSHDEFQSGNAQMLIRLLLQNKIYHILDFSACDFFGQENEVLRCLDASKLLTGLVVNYANNVEILNAISTLKDNKLEQLKLNYSLSSPSVSSRFCEMLKNHQTLVEINLMDSNEFTDGTFLVNLLRTLRAHKSIKHLSLHVSNITLSNQKEDCLRDSLLKDKFISGLCLSKSKISLKLTEALVHASGEGSSLKHLELYENQIHADDISKLQSLYKNGILHDLIISEEPRRYTIREKNNEPEQEQQLNVPNLNINQRWKQDGTTVIGGHGQGNQLNQLSRPCGMFIDSDRTVYVADNGSDRIIEWKMNATNGRIVAGGNGRGNRNDQLNRPTKVIVDKQNDSLVICDWGNRRVVQWPRRNGQSGEILISNIDCHDVIMDNDGYLYVSDFEKHEVRRWKIGETNGTIVAGGNGKGDRLDQLNIPYCIFIDEDQSVYVSDCWNNRVMKWVKGAKEGIVVAGGHGEGNTLTQLSSPQGIMVDQMGSIYIADWRNHRVMRWLKGATEGSIVVGGNEQGEQPNQFKFPADLSFDRESNLYVVDSVNDRMQRFDITEKKVVELHHPKQSLKRS